MRCKIRYHEDERARRFCDLFDGTPGDVNLFVLQPGQVSAWHRHRFQVDQFMVISGKIRFGRVANDGTPEFDEIESVASGQFSTLTVDPGVWHGYQNVGDTPAMLLMYLSHKYEDGWDEERRTLEEMPWNP